MNRFTEEEIDLLNDIYDMFGQFSATKLRNMTHEEQPWKKTPTGVGNVIPRDLMKEYFKGQIAAR